MNTTASASLRDSYSQTTAARYQRERKLRDVAFLEKQNASSRRCHNAKRAKEVKMGALMTNMRSETALDKEVAHHLARGRDAGRIAIWMGLPTSTINEAIERLSATNPTL